MYTANHERYSQMNYRRAAKTGLLLPAISLGLWHNFTYEKGVPQSRDMLLTAFDNGITHFDLANNYGPPPGDAERVFGEIINGDLAGHRDELIVSTKAGYLMWEGPYGEWGSRKNLVASVDQSLRRMRMDYVDIFYSHRYDPNTELEETMCALDQIVRSGKALYAGLSNYPAKPLKKALKILRELRTPVVLHQIKYSMLVRQAEKELFDLHKELSVGCISFSPLAQGLLSDKYLGGIPENSRATLEHFLKSADVKTNIEKIEALNAIAKERGQSLAQMAIAWQLCDERVTSVLIGASSPEQIIENIGAQTNTHFTTEELQAIDAIVGGSYKNFTSLKK